MTFLQLRNIAQQNRSDRHELILIHSNLIIKEVGKTSKAKVAEHLGMQASVFSNVYVYILAYSNLTQKV